MKSQWVLAISAGMLASVLVLGADAVTRQGALRPSSGSVQVTGQNFRAVARIIDTSTATVLVAGRGEGSGCEHGLEQAFAQAISGLPLQSYHAR